MWLLLVARIVGRSGERSDRARCPYDQSCPIRCRAGYAASIHRAEQRVHESVHFASFSWRSPVAKKAIFQISALIRNSPQTCRSSMGRVRSRTIGPQGTCSGQENNIEWDLFRWHESLKDMGDRERHSSDGDKRVKILGGKQVELPDSTSGVHCGRTMSLSQMTG